MLPRLRNLTPALAPWALMLAGWALLFGPTLAGQIARAFRSHAMTDDARIVLFHFAKFADSELFAEDAIGRYHADGTGELFRALYFVLVQGFDILVASKLVAYATFSATLAGVAAAASRLGGRAAAFVAVALVCSTGVFIWRAAGGLPRAFAFPIMAWALWALASGRVRTLAALAVLGAGVYPVLPVILGFSLAVLLLVLPAEDRGSAETWSLRRRLSVLAGTAVAIAVMMVPLALRVQPYGELIRASDVTEFPEAGPSGRIAPRDRSPSKPYAEMAAGSARGALTGAGESFVPAIEKAVRREPLVLNLLAVVSALGILGIGLRRDGAPMRRVASFAAGAVLGFALAEPVSPMLAPGQRYVSYAIPVLTVVLVSVAPLGLVPRRWLGRMRRPEVAGAAFVLCYGGLLLASFGTNGDDIGGSGTFVRREDRRLYSAVSRLPKDSVLAGWPRGMLDALPLMTLRTALITRETYMPYHKTMTLLMRKRLRASVEACFATDTKPLERLRDDFGVTHFIVSKRFWHGRMGKLFRPHSGLVARRMEEYDHERAERFWESLSHAVVYRDRHHRVLALDRL